MKLNLLYLLVKKKNGIWRRVHTAYISVGEAIVFVVRYPHLQHPSGFGQLASLGWGLQSQSLGSEREAFSHGDFLSRVFLWWRGFCHLSLSVTVVVDEREVSSVGDHPKPRRSPARPRGGTASKAIVAKRAQCPLLIELSVACSKCTCENNNLAMLSSLRAFV